MTSLNKLPTFYRKWNVYLCSVHNQIAPNEKVFLIHQNIKHQTYFKRVFYRLKHTLIYATKKVLQMQRICEQSQNNRAKFILFSLKHTSVTTAHTPASMCARVNSVRTGKHAGQRRRARQTEVGLSLSPSWWVSSAAWFMSGHASQQLAQQDILCNKQGIRKRERE